MKNKILIVTSSIAACAIFASLFAFNGYAIQDAKAQTNVATVSNTLQTEKTPSNETTQNKSQTSALEKSQNTQAANVNNSNANDCQNSTASQTTNTAQDSNNQQISKNSAKIIDNLRNAINNANCDKTTAKTRNYSALQSKLESLINSNCGASTTNKTNNTTTTKPTTSKPSTTPTTSKPATNGDYSAFQKKVVELVNIERAKNGLKPLTMNAEVNKTATLKSQDMAKLNYFSHTSPTYGSPFDMMKKYGISYRTAGENIAMGQTSPEQVMQGWMNSSGHRANILKSSFTQIGVGVAKNSNGQLYWTQQFIG